MIRAEGNWYLFCKGTDECFFASGFLRTESLFKEGLEQNDH